MVQQYHKCSKNFWFLTSLFPPPTQIKVTEGPLIKLVLKVNWLSPLGFEGELGNGVEREEFTVDGVSHGSCQG